MKIISELEKLGLTLSDGEKEAIIKKFTEDVITNAEHENKVGKVKGELETSKKDLETANTTISDLQGKIDGFKDINADELQGKIKELTDDLATAKAEAEKVKADHELEKNVSEFLQDKEFVNDFTKKSIVNSLMEELKKDSARGKSISDLFNGIVNGEDGKPLPNILVDTQLEGNKARFTQKSGSIPPAGTKLTTAELMKLANENPGLDISQYLIK